MRQFLDIGKQEMLNTYKYLCVYLVKLTTVRLKVIWTNYFFKITIQKNEVKFTKK